MEITRLKFTDHNETTGVKSFLRENLIFIILKIKRGEKMGQEVIINDMPIQTTELQVNKIQKDGNERIIIDMGFKVESKDSHDITTLLYKNDFVVKVPEKDLELPATIYNYYTSITDLYVEGNVADFKLVLIEKI